MQKPIVAVFGLSGVGKSWLIGRYTAHYPAIHIQASQLLREAKAAQSGKSVTSEELRQGAVLDNQALLIQAFDRVRATATLPLIFDGHCVVDDGMILQEIPANVISSLAITHLVFIEGSPADIAQRRRDDQTRVRPARTEAELAQHHERAKAVCETYSQDLGLPLTMITSGNYEAFFSTLNAAFQKYN